MMARPAGVPLLRGRWLGADWHRPVRSDMFQYIAIDAIDQNISGIAQPRGSRRDRIQHRLHVGRRAGDDPKDFTSRSLLFQRLFEFLEQPDVLNGNHRLGSKGFQQFNLLIRERTEFSSADMNSTNGNTFTK